MDLLAGVDAASASAPVEVVSRKISLAVMGPVHRVGGAMFVGVVVAMAFGGPGPLPSPSDMARAGLRKVVSRVVVHRFHGPDRLHRPQSLDRGPSPKEPGRPSLPLLSLLDLPLL